MKKVVKLEKEVEKKGIGLEIGWDGDIYLGFFRTYHEAMRGSEVFQDGKKISVGPGTLASRGNMGR